MERARKSVSNPPDTITRQGSVAARIQAFNDAAKNIREKHVSLTRTADFVEREDALQACRPI